MVSTQSERGFISANAYKVANIPHIDISKLLGAALETTGYLLSPIESSPQVVAWEQGALMQLCTTGVRN